MKRSLVVVLVFTSWLLMLTARATGIKLSDNWTGHICLELSGAAYTLAVVLFARGASR